MSHSRPRTCLLSTTVHDVAVTYTWPFNAQQQFVSLCGESMEKNQAVFGPVATWENNIGAGL